MKKLQVEFNGRTVNPFYGMQNTLDIYQNASKGNQVTISKLKAAKSECKTDEQLALLFCVLFFVGDVSNRQHNLLNIKVENGGNSQRHVFRDSIIPFLVDSLRDKKVSDRLRLMALITEYTTMDNILAARVKTKKKTQKVESVINMIDVFGVKDVVNYCVNIIQKGTEFQKLCLAKFLTRPRFSKRSKSSKILPETTGVMLSRALVIRGISDKCGFPYQDFGSYIVFEGYNNWKKQYNGELESVLFSSGAIKDFDKEQFITFIDSCPSDARFRVKNKVCYPDKEIGKNKWGELGDWYKEWENFKENAQSRQRELESKIEEGIATETEKEQLGLVKKHAKVNTGAMSFTSMYADIINGNIDKVKIQPFLDKIKLPYNTLTFIDDSSSMNSSWGNKYPFTARQMAAFIATVCLMKNPDPEARNIVGLFSRDCRVFSGVSAYNNAPNSLMRGKTIKTVKKPLIDTKLHFLDNLSKLKRFLDAETTGNGTNISSIPDNLNNWVSGDTNRLEEIQRCPVWTLISDGNFNNLGGAASSLNDFFRRCENYFGFKPYLVLIDVSNHTSQNVQTFTGIDNVMLVPPSPNNIEMLLTNFKDMDVYDVYTPLLSLSRSKRYAPIRDFVLEGVKTKTQKLEKV